MRSVLNNPTQLQGGLKLTTTCYGIVEISSLIILRLRSTPPENSHGPVDTGRRLHSKSKSHSPNMHVVIVGSGIAGLACAIGIRKSGHSVTALERAQVAKEVSAEIPRVPYLGNIISHSQVVRWWLVDHSECHTRIATTWGAFSCS